MNLSYEASLDDLVEPVMRFHMRSKSARVYKIRSTILNAVVSGLVGAFILRDSSTTLLIAGVLICMALSGTLSFFTYEWRIRRRVWRHMHRETEGRLPARTTFTKGDGCLRCEWLGVRVSYALHDLEHISEDKQWIEISFGQKGLCTIPIRAFADRDEMKCFLTELKSEQVSGANRCPSQHLRRHG